ncbi:MULTISPECIES: hypothetical protein [Rhizobium]|nr:MULTISPECIES: hypothetical protein [Rhizobium]
MSGPFEQLKVDGLHLRSEAPPGAGKIRFVRNLAENRLQSTHGRSRSRGTGARGEGAAMI